MLKIAEYNKITGKKIELSELEKFGFNVDMYNLWYECHSKENNKDSIIVNIENRKLSFYQNYNGKSYDLLYDLIEAGYVEKVEE